MRLLFSSIKQKTISCQKLIDGLKKGTLTVHKFDDNGGIFITKSAECTDIVNEDLPYLGFVLPNKKKTNTYTRENCNLQKLLYYRSSLKNQDIIFVNSGIYEYDPLMLAFYCAAYKKQYEVMLENVERACLEIYGCQNTYITY